jgi:hypothetical protein
MSVFLALMLGATAIERAIESRHRRQRLGDPVQFWDTNSECRTYYVIFGGELSEDSEIRTHWATAYTFSLISEFLTDLLPSGCKVELFPARVRTNLWKDVLGLIKDFNVVILGGSISFPPTVALLESLNTPFRQEANGLPRKIVYCDKTLNAPNDPNQPTYPSNKQNNYIQRDFALVTRVLHKTTKNLLVMISGNYGVGTAGAGIALTTNDQFPRNSFNTNAEAQQLVIGTDSPDIGNLVYRGGPTHKISCWTSRVFTPPETWLNSLESKKEVPLWSRK